MRDYIGIGDVTPGVGGMGHGDRVGVRELYKLCHTWTGEKNLNKNYNNNNKIECCFFFTRGLDATSVFTYFNIFYYTRAHRTYTILLYYTIKEY